MSTTVDTRHLQLVIGFTERFRHAEAILVPHEEAAESNLRAVTGAYTPKGYPRAASWVCPHEIM